MILDYFIDNFFIISNLYVSYTITIGRFVVGFRRLQHKKKKIKNYHFFTVGKM